MTAMHDRPFPFRAPARTMPAMASDASLVLRERRGLVRVRVNWPPPECGDTNPVLVFLSTEDEPTDSVDALCRAICADGCVVVLSVRTACPDTATTALEWAADHAAQLEADPGRVLLGGAGRGGALAAQVALLARENGWPSLAGDVLVVDDEDALCDVAPVLRSAMSSDRARGLKPHDHDEELN
jgi:alpha/beta hydrolase family protein